LLSNPRRKPVEKAAKKKAPGSDEAEARIVFRLKNVTKNWSGEHGFELTVPELIIRQNEKVALVGFSGCGKSTLLDLLAMILQPDQVPGCGRHLEAQKSGWSGPRPDAIYRLCASDRGIAAVSLRA
jgi:ATPase subunit of ABC transporter with duplicated ATPase domains